MVLGVGYAKPFTISVIYAIECVDKSICRDFLFLSKSDWCMS